MSRVQDLYDLAGPLKLLAMPGDEGKLQALGEGDVDDVRSPNPDTKRYVRSSLAQCENYWMDGKGRCPQDFGQHLEYVLTVNLLSAEHAGNLGWEMSGNGQPSVRGCPGNNPFKADVMASFVWA
ncbi:hypothetical protein BH24CHL4_BH24CHL4_22980 [soil metagenome]